MSDMSKMWDEFAVRFAVQIERHVEARLKTIVAETFKANLKVVFTEPEAAAFLSVSTDTLAGWRKRGLLEYARYPVSRVRAAGDEDRLSDMVTYDLAGLLSFRARYIVNAVSPNKYELVPRFSVIGPAVEEKT